MRTIACFGFGLGLLATALAAGAGDATARLRDGQRVLVDGTKGTVVPLDED